ncbi:phytase [Sphingomonas sp. SUN019]|uniref:phytase n=1 Tax=Sphingomonas sp. SUN019 TaxID=2937788 RepID=UPI0021643FB1|nr:phytase [Sphingomonas sp. SUN019]UVO49973.1 phytase [Sphingomonas sp. SUN019]
MTPALPNRVSCVTLALAVVLSGCATAPPTWEAIAARSPAPVVTASRETDAVATANADAADDPAIWRNGADPARSLIVGTDKKAGLNVYDLTGKQRSFADAGRVNNVDLIADQIAGEAGVLVAASDRNDVLAAKVALFRLDTAAATLVPLGTVGAGAGEAYGICLAARGGGVDAFVVLKDGTINQVALDLSGARPAGRIVRTMKLATQSEGCVVDARTQRLYVAEEDAGIWRFDARADGPTTAIPVAKVDGRNLVADVEGLALAGKWLVASSQGDNAYAVYDLATDAYVGRFRIGAGTLGATSETDGIEVAIGDFGPDFPAGVMIAQDGDNAPNAQNFKVVDWRQVEAAIARK